MSRGIAIDFAIDFGVDFAIDFAPHFAAYANQGPHPPKTAPKMASSNTLHAKIAPILTLRLVLAPKSSKSPPYAYLSRRLCFKIVEIPSLRGHSKFLHAQNILQDRLLNFRHPKIFDMRHELNLRRTKIFDMGYEKFQGSTYRTFRTSVML